MRKELCRILGYAQPQSVARAHKRGALPIAYTIVAGRAVYDQAAIDAYLLAQRRTPPRKAA